MHVEVLQSPGLAEPQPTSATATNETMMAVRLTRPPLRLGQRAQHVYRITIEGLYQRAPMDAECDKLTHVCNWLSPGRRRSSLVRGRIRKSQRCRARMCGGRRRAGN